MNRYLCGLHSKVQAMPAVCVWSRFLCPEEEPQEEVAIMVTVLCVQWMVTQCVWVQEENVC